jgi:two-component sensor histidine kinase
MSLLNLHARRIRDPRAELAFAEARSRINALATLHRRLYESESLQEIDLKWFLEDLCAELRRGGLSRGRSVELVANSPSEVIGPEIAVPLGLLVTEAITNAYKHAFNEGTGGHIYVDVRRPSAETLELAVRDDGSGFDPAAGEDNTGLGRSLIEAFVRQLRGELEISGDAGTSLVVRFPAPARKPEGGIALSAGPVSATPGDSVAAAPLPSTES